MLLEEARSDQQNRDVDYGCECDGGMSIPIQAEIVRVCGLGSGHVWWMGGDDVSEGVDACCQEKGEMGWPYSVCGI